MLAIISLLLMAALYLVVIGLFAWIATLLIGLIPMDANFKQVAVAIIYVLAVIVAVVYVLISALGGSLPTPLSR